MPTRLECQGERSRDMMRPRSRDMRHAGVAILIIGALAVNVRLVPAAQSAACTPAGGLSFICGVQNPEDLVVVPNSRWMLASGMAPGSGLHLVDTNAKTVSSVYAA